MKESKTLIIGFTVFVVLVLFASGFFFSGREVLFAEAHDPGSTILGVPNDGDVLIETPEGDYIWVADEPNEPIQRLMNLFEQVLEQEDRLIDIVGLCLDRIKRLEEPNEPE